MHIHSDSDTLIASNTGFHRQKKKILSGDREVQMRRDGLHTRKKISTKSLFLAMDWNPT